MCHVPQYFYAADVIFFFFQAEDGIRDIGVTGVQTCALPIWLLGPRTVAYMTRNHLPGDVDLETFGRPIFAESANRGVGFGLGVSVVVDAAAGKMLTHEGEFAWGGLASTAFYVDPAAEVTAMFFTQLLPSSTYPI